MNFNRRELLATGAALSASAFAPLVRAQDFPGRQAVTLVVPFAAGGNLDMVTRNLAAPLGVDLAQSVVVDNRAGGGGTIGVDFVARSPANGYTLLSATPAQLGTLPHLLKTSYKRDELIPIGIVSKTPILLIVRQRDERFKTVQEFLAFARKNPGKLNVGHGGPGSPNHVAMLQFEKSAGCQFNGIGYRGMGPALVDMLSGQIDVVFDQISSSTPHIKAGTFRPLAVLAPTGVPAMPELPTLKQVGLPEFDITTYVGLFAPRATPRPVVDRLRAAVKKAAGDARFEKVLADAGSTAHFGDADELDRVVRMDEAVAVELIKEGKLTAL